MAILDDIDYGAGQDSMETVFDKTNAVIDAVKNAAPGTVGSILRYQSTTDYDFVPSSEFAYKCAATSASTSVTTNYASVIFVVPAGMQFEVGNRLRATGSAGNWIEGITTAASGTGLTILVDRIKGTGSFTAWTINAGDGESETAANTTTPNVTSSTIILTPATITSNTIYYNYKKIGKLLYLNFKAVIVINSGGNVSKIKIPMPTGITKDTADTSNYFWFGSGRYSCPTCITTIVPLSIKSYDDGTEGQRIVCERADEVIMVLTSGQTLTVTGQITMSVL
jgi:hypothetical protein